MSTASELRLPAQRQYIVVAKRAAAAFGVVAGFDVEAIDDLTIATAQACENAITVAERNAGPHQGQLRLTFQLEEGRLELQVRSICKAVATESADVRETNDDVLGVVAVDPCSEEGLEQIRLAHVEALAATDLALRVMGLFVDDCNYRVDERRGGLRVRMTKYRA